MSSSVGQGSSQRSQAGSWSEGPLPAKRLCSPWTASTSDHPGGARINNVDASSTSSDVGDMTQNDVTHVRQASNPFMNASSSDLRDGDEDTQVYMSVMWQGGRLGLAYYDVQTTQVHMMPDTLEADDFTLLRRVITQIQPTAVVMSTKTDDRLIQAIKHINEAVSSSGEESVLRADGTGDQSAASRQMPEDYVIMLPSIDFNLDLAKQRLLTLNLPGIPDHFTPPERSLYLSSLVPFDSVNMVRAVGGLLKLLDKRRVGVELEDSTTRVPVMSLHIFSLKDLMYVDDGSYSSLNIFSGEVHPSAYKAGSNHGAKEGLSLFGILNRCRTQNGSRLLRQWFLRPSTDIEMLRARQEAIEFLVSPGHGEVATSITSCLRQIKNVARVLVRMNRGEASLADWQALYQTAYNCIYIGDICRAQTNKVDIMKRISEKFTDDLHGIASVINKIVDFEESRVQNRFVVKHGVDPELDKMKRTYNGLPDFLTTVAREEFNKLSSDIDECTVIYLPQLGYMLQIPLCGAIREEDEYALPGLEFLFVSNQKAHYRSASTLDLDRLLGDTQCEIADHETSIMLRLQNLILEHSQVLLDSLGLAAELDCLLALAACASDGNYVKPELTKDNIIQIKGGRHPLQELCCSPFVPNDAASGGESAKVKILTGPNASGKSVYLKQVGLIVFMAQLGSFVPAESAVIGVLDAIYTRIQTVDSVSVGLSTFMIDLNQVSTAIRNATARSLVIIDEFGKGTAASDGIALLCACIRYWLDKAEECPHIMVSTHFHSVVSQRLLPKSNLLQYLTMEFLRDGEDLVFLYQLIEGTTNCSYACHIAAQADLPPEIVSRGKEVSNLVRQHEVVQRIDSANTETHLKRCEDVVSKFLELDLEEDDVETFLKNTLLALGESIK